MSDPLCELRRNFAKFRAVSFEGNGAGATLISDATGLFEKAGSFSSKKTIGALAKAKLLWPVVRRKLYWKDEAGGCA